MKRLVIIFALLAQAVCFGQVRVESIGGVCRLDGHTREEAEKIAEDNAKRNAVEKAFGSEVSYGSLLKHKDGRESFYTKTETRNSAVVKVLSKGVSYTGNIVTVWINADVYKCNGEAPISFLGEKQDYGDNEQIQFEIEFHRPSYLHIFWIDEDTGEGDVLYPRGRRGSKEFCADGGYYRFPGSSETPYFGLICPDAMSYEDKYREYSKTGKLDLKKSKETKMPSSGKLTEGKWIRTGSRRAGEKTKHITIIFVTTNNNVHFNASEVNEETLLDWWCDLPIQERSSPVKKHLTLRY